MKKVSKSLKETKKIAEDFLKFLLKKYNKEARVVELSGNLGAGKTAFTKHLAKALGIKRRVASPTFVLIRRYEIKKGKFKQLFHIDAYRLKSEQDILKLGWKEIISNKEHLVLIEWPEKVTKVLPKNSSKIKISHGKNEMERHFNIKI